MKIAKVSMEYIKLTSFCISGGSNDTHPSLHVFPHQPVSCQHSYPVVKLGLKINGLQLAWLDAKRVSR